MTINAKTTYNNTKVQIKKILNPIDGSEYSFNAARCAIEVAKNENSKLYCIHVISTVWVREFSVRKDQYYKDLEQKVQSWFDKVREMAVKEGISELKTRTFTGVKSVIGSIIDYATTRDIDLIAIGTRGRTGLKRLFVGSLANGVVQHAHCSVLLVR
jgi:nucleotide-binding universal stress UspA family protein